MHAYSAIVLKKLTIAAGNKLPDDITPVVEKHLAWVSKKKVINQALALHQQKKQGKNIECCSTQQLGNKNVAIAKPGRLGIQYFRN